MKRLPLVLLAGPLATACFIPVRESRHPRYGAPMPVASAPACSVRYLAEHPVPDAQGGGWCFIDGDHCHDYFPPHVDQYSYDGRSYSFGADINYTYVDVHPVPYGGWCNERGPHSHRYRPTSDFNYDEPQRTWVYRPTPGRVASPQPYGPRPVPTGVGHPQPRPYGNDVQTRVPQPIPTSAGHPQPMPYGNDVQTRVPQPVPTGTVHPMPYGNDVQTRVPQPTPGAPTPLPHADPRPAPNFQPEPVHPGAFAPTPVNPTLPRADPRPAPNFQPEPMHPGACQPAPAQPAFPHSDPRPAPNFQPEPIHPGAFAPHVQPTVPHNEPRPAFEAPKPREPNIPHPVSPAQPVFQGADKPAGHALDRYRNVKIDSVNANTSAPPQNKPKRGPKFR